PVSAACLCSEWRKSLPGGDAAVAQDASVCAHDGDTGMTASHVPCPAGGTEWSVRGHQPQSVARRPVVQQWGCPDSRRQERPLPYPPACVVIGLFHGWVFAVWSWISLACATIFVEQGTVRSVAIQSGLRRMAASAVADRRTRTWPGPTRAAVTGASPNAATIAS